MWRNLTFRLQHPSLFYLTVLEYQSVKILFRAFVLTRKECFYKVSSKSVICRFRKCALFNKLLFTCNLFRWYSCLNTHSWRLPRSIQRSKKTTTLRAARDLHKTAKTINRVCRVASAEKAVDQRVMRVCVYVYVWLVLEEQAAEQSPRQLHVGFGAVCKCFPASWNGE